MVVRRQAGSRQMGQASTATTSAAAAAAIADRPAQPDPRRPRRRPRHRLPPGGAATLDDGHGIQAIAQGGGTITADGEEFELQTVRASTIPARN